jgi:hypothetical protein
MATVKEVVRNNLPPQTHDYDANDIGPLEFLQCVYRAAHLPMSIRIDAARGLLPYTEPRPACAPSSLVGCTIVIGGLGPYDHGSAPKDPDGVNGKSQSFPPSASYNHQPFLTTPGPSYIEKILERMSLDEIIKTVANTPEHLLPICTICNHPMMYPCSVAPLPPTYTDPRNLPCVTRHTKETMH